MKHFFLLLLSCLWWLMTSCASTPPAEEPVLQGENQAEQSPQGNAVADAVVEERGVSEDNALSVEDFLPPLEDKAAEDMSALLQQDDNQDYLQEIEIIDLMKEDESQADENFSPDEMAVVLESEPALVVETPKLTEDVVPSAESQDAEEEDKALVVEQSGETSEDSLVTEPSEALVSVPDSPSGADDVIETTPETQPTASATANEETVDTEQAITQENAEPVDVNSTQGVLDDVAIPSRSVVMGKNQYLDIRYPGTGWVYLGEVTRDGESVGSPRMTYFGRRRTSEDTSFTMRSSKAGATILHFFKQDVLSATFIDDFLEVTITEEEAENGFRVIAPSYEKIVPGYQDTIPQPQDFAWADSPSSEITSTEPNDTLQSEMPAEDAAVDSVATRVPDYTPSGDSLQPSAGTLPSATTTTQQTADRTPAATQGETAPATTQQTAGDSAPMIVPPRTETTASSGSSQEHKPVQSSPLQQELYEPETTSPADTSQDSYNPQTGLSMDDLSLPWVTKELEEQRTKNPSETSASQEEQLNLHEEQDALLAQAQEYFYAEDFPASLETLNKFFDIAVKELDAGYYLMGQVLESQSSVKNVKEAKKAYKHVIDSYPQSPFWERSQNRFIYLNRFYFDIR